MNNPHLGLIKVLADLDYPPRITLDPVEWIPVFAFMVAAAGLVIWLFTTGTAVLIDSTRDQPKPFRASADQRKPLEAIGLFAIGAVAAWIFRHLLQWELGHTESGLSASAVTLVTLLLAAAVIAAQQWFTVDEHWKMWLMIPGVVIATVVCGVGLCADIYCRANFLEPHRETVAPAAPYGG